MFKKSIHEAASSFRKSAPFFAFCAALAIGSGGCAQAVIITRGAVATAGPIRPGVTDPLSQSRREPSVTGFGARRKVVDSPNNLPIPSSANVDATFRMPGVTERAAKDIYTVVGSTVFFLCRMPDLDGTSNDCNLRHNDYLVIPNPRKPVISR